MGTLTVITNLTLDGVMQAPGSPDEDPRDGFAHGGWAAPYAGDAMGRLLARSPGDGAMLLGRRTYQRFAAYWPTQADSPYARALEARRKYVASRTPAPDLSWVNSIPLAGDAAGTVPALKDKEPRLVVLGSGELVGALLSAGLVDEVTLLIHPLVLGSGRRLFPEGAPPAGFRLDGCEATTTGVVIATYRPVR